MDPRFDRYSRKVYSVLELLGDIGGLTGSLHFIGLAIITFISNRIFASEIMRQMYQVKDRENFK
jgi:hypothetical protein